jgi:hypothetical protein
LSVECIQSARKAVESGGQVFRRDDFIRFRRPQFNRHHVAESNFRGAARPAIYKQAMPAACNRDQRALHRCLVNWPATRILPECAKERIEELTRAGTSTKQFTPVF